MIVGMCVGCACVDDAHRHRLPRPGCAACLEGPVPDYGDVFSQFRCVGGATASACRNQGALVILVCWFAMMSGDMHVRLMLTAIACRSRCALAALIKLFCCACHEVCLAHAPIHCTRTPTPFAVPLCPGMDFAGVHDSFWTHAGDVDRMSEILRDKFIELYSQVRSARCSTCWACWARCRTLLSRRSRWQGLISCPDAGCSTGPTVLHSVCTHPSAPAAPTLPYPHHTDTLTHPLTHSAPSRFPPCCSPCWSSCWNSLSGSTPACSSRHCRRWASSTCRTSATRATSSAERSAAQQSAPKGHPPHAPLLQPSAAQQSAPGGRPQRSGARCSCRLRVARTAGASSGGNCGRDAGALLGRGGSLGRLP